LAYRGPGVAGHSALGVDARRRPLAGPDRAALRGRTPVDHGDDARVRGDVDGPHPARRTAVVALLARPGRTVAGRSLAAGSPSRSRRPRRFRSHAPGLDSHRPALRACVAWGSRRTKDSISRPFAR
jgi:hypothetical protein